MFTKLLVPLDGSPLAEWALPYAESLARACAARLVLARATLIRPLPGQDPSRARRRALEEAEQYLSTLAAGLGERGVDVEQAAVYGEAAQAILDQAQLGQVDLVVMATHGRSGLGRWLYGSVAEAVLAHSPVPVLLARAWPQATASLPLAARARLLVPLDGSAFAEAAVPVAERLAAMLGGEVVLMRAVPPPLPSMVHDDILSPTTFELEAARADARDYLARVASGMALAPEAITTELRIGMPVEAIATAGREHQVALVVMATHGRTGLERLLLGSVAAGALRRASLPLLLVRPPAVAPATDLLPRMGERKPASGPLLGLALTEDDVILLRAALQTLSQTAPNHATLQERLRRLLSRLQPQQDEAPSASGQQAVHVG